MKSVSESCRYSFFIVKEENTVKVTRAYSEEINLKKRNNNSTEKRGADKTARRFIITEEYNGKRNLSDIFADLLYSEYCKKEQQNNAKKSAN